MDTEERLELIMREPTIEVITPKDLKLLLETKEEPIAYNGFEPSGKVHLGTGLICAYKIKDLIEARVKVKIFLATYHAMINNKFRGDLNKIRLAAEHFKYAWQSLGVPIDKVEFLYADELYKDLNYWTRVLLVAKELTITRARRTLEIAGRREFEIKKVADLVYTPMQVSDIFQLKVDICQLGSDQRKANVIAREVGPKLGLWKPVCVHHHLLQGLLKPPIWPIPKGEEREVLSFAKMSKSIPGTAIFIYDTPEEIRRKIRRAFCPPKEIDFNPILDIIKYIIFREKDRFVIERPKKYGGRKEYLSYEELKKDYMKGEIHPLDLKNTVAEYLVGILKPVREFFAKNINAKKSLETINSLVITR